MDTLLERFTRYARIDTQAVEGATGYPSSAKQLELCRMLARECQEIGLADVAMNDFGIVTATVPASTGCRAPAIAWFAHVDTSPEFTAENVKPIVHPNYDGRDLVLPGDPSRVLRTAENPALTKLIGRTIITTDGTTLLGADDKSGIAVIMTAAAYLLAHPEVVHGPIRVCFTCDEEVGHGVDHVDLDKLDVVCGYTLDSEGCGRIDSETFSADLAIVKVTGVNTHPSIGKGAMVNAVRILSDFISRMPTERLSPETTDARDGFLHPYQMSGGVASASARIILRDFETATLADHAGLLERIAEELRTKHPRARIEVEIHKQYRNMRDGLPKEPRALAKAIDAVKAAGLEPELSQIRGGTDGSVLTERGLPTPNLSSGQHNPHSPLEWTCLEEMQKAVDILIELAKAWGLETRS
ncbi:MAG TPA: peptidase T [Planctomycetaceae bacterium]|jgi:tripeptide aminopeptidase|nr:peptidase T [Planctomycetaceae bacterium]